MSDDFELGGEDETCIAEQASICVYEADALMF